MCLYPRLISNPKYKPNKKNKGVVPVVNDTRVLLVPVGCGKCLECRKKKAREWQVRLNEEITKGNKAYFVTLTFSNEQYAKLYSKAYDDRLTPYDIDNEIATIAVRQFTESWRKENKKTIRHWLITELGGVHTEHIHLHGILWTDLPPETIRRHWKKGYVWIGDKPNNYVSQRTVNYIVKYVTKIDAKHREYKPKMLCSKGIGNNYLNKYNSTKNIYKGKDTDETYRTKKGNKIALPMYYRSKIYNDEDKEALWLQRLDKKERYVLGQRISIKDSEDEYYKALTWAQEKNIRMGYGDGSVIDWNRKQYENERRILKQVERGALTKDDAKRIIEQFKIYRKKLGG